jgi:hypothetical protein
LYLVGVDKVQATPTMGCNSRSLIDHFTKLEKVVLNQKEVIEANEDLSSKLEDILKRPLEMLATSASSTQDFMQKLTQIQAQNSDKTSRSFKKIAPKYQKMLLVASSHGEVVPTELNEQAMEFFNQSSVLNAQIFLNSHLEALKIDCSISSALTTSLMHGSFLWSSSLTPSGLASLVITSSDIIGTDTLQEGIVLDYSTKHEMSNNSLNKLTKTQILVPTNVDTSIERFKAIHAVIELILGRGSLPQQGAKKFLNQVIDNKQILRSQQFLDEMFISKLHFTFDHRLNQWLNQCCRVDNVIETNLELILFSSMISDIQMNRFNCYIPPSFGKLQKKKEEKEVNPNKKLKRQENQVESVKNQSQDKNWKLRVDESWDSTFKNKSKEGPTLSVGCKPCLKFHTKGLCYSDCPFVKSHKQLQGNDKNKMNDFILKEIRGE